MPRRSRPRRPTLLKLAVVDGQVTGVRRHETVLARKADDLVAQLGLLVGVPGLIAARWLERLERRRRATLVVAFASLGASPSDEPRPTFGRLVSEPPS